MLNEELEREENNMFFICPQGHVRLDFDESSDYEFLCPACGEELEFQDNTETIEQIKEDIKMVESNFNSFTEKNK
jgi:transcription initiation factor TFIIE subunit alpha